MAIDKAKQRARWVRNKRAQRDRQKVARPSLAPIDAELERLVWAERDKRLSNFPWWVYDLKERRFYPRRTSEQTYPFICDVWAAITLLESQRNDRPITNAMIGSFLWERGMTHGVKRASMRTKIPRARMIIKHLEDAPARDFKGPYWPMFPGSVADHGSGLQQHVDLVMASLDIKTQSD